MISNERLILAALVKNEEYTRKVFAFIKPEYFTDDAEKRVFETISDYLQKYNHAPNQTTLKVQLGNDETITEQRTDECSTVVEDIFTINPGTSMDWLMETTEAFCQKQAVYNAIQKSISIYQGEDVSLQTAAIPDILQSAIAVCFDNRVGSDYFDDAEARWQYYVDPESKIPFRLEIFNEVTCGGIPRKTLNLIIAGVNVGKTMSLIDLAADYVRDGLNVLYFSQEMSEQAISQRMDANQMRVAINDIVSLGKDRFMSRLESIKAKSVGRFKVKEYPPGTASTLDFKRCIDELKLKQGFIPDIIMVDYVQITASARMKYGNTGSYYYYKSVSEEMRALAVVTNTVMWSAGQFNRGNMAATEVDMDGIAESVGIAHTADGVWAFMRTEDLDQAKQLLVKQLKSRYANKAVRTRFTIGVDIEKQTLFDVNQTEQENIVQPEKVKVPSGAEIKQKFLSMGMGDEQ